MSCEVSMFIMMILIILLTRAHLAYTVVLCIPSWCKSLESSVICERSTTLLTGLTLNQANAWAISILLENCSLIQETFLFLLIVNVCRNWMSNGAQVQTGKMPQQVCIRKNNKKYLLLLNNFYHGVLWQGISVILLLWCCCSSRGRG